MELRWISAPEIDQLLSYPSLISAIREAFFRESSTPERGHFSYSVPDTTTSSTLLIMPSWVHPSQMGVKLVTVSPHNAQHSSPVIQGLYVLFNRSTGAPELLLDGPRLTAWRTAATSALAADVLAPAQPKSLLVMGTGTLAPELVKAHLSVRSYPKVMIWGRNTKKAHRVVNKLSIPEVNIQAVSDLPQAVAEADVISAATLAVEPILHGAWLRPGQHIDLVGSYRPDMRESDDEVVRRARLFVDERKSDDYITGDLAIPLADQTISHADIEADLFDFCRTSFSLQRKPTDITLFKSVGHALEDLAAAQLILKSLA